MSIADGGARDKTGGGDKTSVCTTSCGGRFTLTFKVWFNLEALDTLRGGLGWVCGNGGG